MDVRRSDNPLARRAVAGMHALNARHPWSHNDHFHRWVLRRLPRQRHRALDVGCGEGRLLERLAPYFTVVEGIDPDEAMVAAAARRTGHLHDVTVRRAAFDDCIGPYDVVTMVAVLHHLDLEQALRHAADVIAPGGRLLVVGLARPATASDVAVDLVSSMLNPLVGLAKHPRRAGGRLVERFPTRDPQLTFAEIRRVSRVSLPGCRTRRRLFFRYTLEWTKA